MKYINKKKGLRTIIYDIWKELSFSILCSIISSLCLILSIIILSYSLSSLINHNSIKILTYELNLINIILIMSILIVLSFFLRLLSFFISHLGAFKLEQILRTKLSSHFAKIPFGYILTNGSGSLKKVMLSDVKSLHSFVADSIPMIAKSTISPLVAVSILFIVDYRLALASLSVLTLGFIFMSLSFRDSDILREKYEQSHENINKSVIEFVQAMPIVRTFDDGSKSFNKFTEALISYKKHLIYWMKVSSFTSKLGIIVLSPLPTLLVVLFVSLIFFESIETSHLILTLFLSTAMADSLMPVMWLINFIKKSQAAAIRIQEVLDVEILESPNNTKIPENNNISFENVYFSYNKNEHYALKNINLNIKENTVVAFVGSSGAGKTTIARLIPRFWDVTKGSIKIGNINIKDIDTHTLMDKISFVFQENFLFKDTIYNNIQIANKKATKQDIINAAKAAQIHDFIMSLPNNYNTNVSDRGINLSGGEKQRITIARAILRNSPIVILDEPTSFSDPQNEEQLIKAFSNLVKNKTVIIIAHRLSTVKNANEIIVFNEGEIIEKGKHNDLLKNRSIYYSLWTNYIKAQNWDLTNKKERNEQ